MKKFLKKYSSKIFFILFLISFMVAANNVYYKHRIRESIRRRFSNALSAVSTHIYLMDGTDERQKKVKNFARDAKLVLDITYFADDNELCHNNRKNLEEVINSIEKVFCNDNNKIKITDKKRETIYKYLNQIATYPSDVSTSIKVIKELESIKNN